MKAQMLKIAGVKSEKEFYKKYATEEAFMKAHGKEFKKAMRAGGVKKAQVGRKQPSPYLIFGQTNTPSILSQYPGLSQMQIQQQAQQQPAIGLEGPMMAAGAVGGSSALSDTGVSSTLKTIEGIRNTIAGQTGGSKKRKTETTDTTDTTTTKSPYLESALDVVEGLSMIGAQSDAVKEAKQSAALTDVQAQAAASMRSQPIKRKYVRPEDLVIQPGQLFPPQGNVRGLAFAQDGVEVTNTIGGIPGEIMNVYNPGTLYDELGYEPLEDSSKLKRFQNGGFLEGLETFAEQGGGQIGGVLGELVGNWGRGPSAGSKIGGGIGQAAGTAIGGPIGGMVGKFLGGALGGALDPAQRKIEEYNKQSARNVARMMGAQGGIQSQFSGFMKDGGQVSDYEWVSHTWQPQVITHFGEHRVSDLLKPPSDADMLRAGGEIKSIRKNYISPEEQLLTQMAFGGELKTTWGGYAKPTSQNPHLPGTGQIIEFYGNTHDQKDRKGRTGIGVEYGPDSYTQYAEYGAEANADVEVEKGEPAVELPDTRSQLLENSEFAAGGHLNNRNLSMNVFGNLVISDLVSPEYARRKYKDVVKDLSKKTTILNRKVEKAIDEINNLNPQDPFSMTKFNSLNATVFGGNMKLKKIADDIENLAIGQNATNKTAEEMGLVADDLAKGKIKIDKNAFKQEAKFGKEVPKAQRGKSVMALEKPRAAKTTPFYAYRDGKPYYFYYNTEPYTDERGIKYAPGEYQFSRPAPEMYANLQQELIRRGVITPSTISPTTPSPSPATTTAQAQKPAPKTTTAPAIASPKRPTSAAVGRPATTAQSDGYVSKYGFTPWVGDRYSGIKNASVYTAKEWDEIADRLGFDQTGKRGNKAFQEFLWNIPEAREMIMSNHQRLYKSDPSTRTRWFDDKLGAGWAAPGLKDLGKKTSTSVQPNTFKFDVPPATEDGTQEQVVDQATTKFAQNVYKRNKAMDMFNQLLPYLRPSDAETLDPNQLVGELYALSTNQPEGVWAQTLQPELDIPMDISLQDILNENEATYRSQQRMVGYDPAAQAQLSAQKYAANQKILGEEFRLNQLERKNVYAKNRDIINDFKFKNLALLDQQYVRQNEALSKTKATNLEALSSIASKIAQNKLENRQLRVYENLYNYRYDPAFRAINMNPLYQANIPTVATRVPIIDEQGNIIGYQQMGTDKTPSTTGKTTTKPVVSTAAQRPVLATTGILPDQLYTPAPSAEDIELQYKGGGGYRKGGKVKKNEQRNSAIVKALKNI